MKNKLNIYHGSQKIIEKPIFGYGKRYNDYGLGFYCTENIELAKEWACPIKNDGYANKYSLSLDGLNVIQLTKGSYNILNWLAVLLSNRKFDINAAVGENARAFILSHFMPDLTNTDIMIGYRADDSYFSFAEDFVNNLISLRDLNYAMQLGTLGEQVVLISEKSFEKIDFLGYDVADYREHYFKKVKRDEDARKAYFNKKKNLEQLKDDIFILDIIREDMKNDDPRLQSVISE